MTNHMKSDVKNTTDTTVDKAQGVAEEVQQKAGETVSVAKEQVKRTATQVSEQAKSTVDSRLSDVAQELGTVAETVRQASYEAAGNGNSEVVVRYGERIAEQLDGISSYLNENGIEEVLTDLQDFARRKPGVFLGGAFMLGIVVGRFLRSTGDSGYGYRQGAQESYESDYSDSSYRGGSSYGYQSGNRFEGSNRYQTGIAQESTTTQSGS